MRLHEFLKISHIESVQILGTEPDELRQTVEQMGVPVTATAATFITLVDAASSMPAISTSALAEALGMDHTPGTGIVMIPESAIETFPWSLLAQVLAESGWSADTVAELEYEHVRRVIMIHRGASTPWVNPALGPRPPVSDEQSQFLSLFTPSLYVLERFDHAERPERDRSTVSGDGAEEPASHMLRERRRVEAEFQRRLTRMMKNERQALASAAEASAELKDLRASKRFLLGSLLVEAPRRPRRSASIAKKITSHQVPAEPVIPEVSELEPVSIPSFIQQGFSQPQIVFGTKPHAVVMVASRSRRGTWSSAVRVSMPIPGKAVHTLEDAPKMVVIEASALLSGRWGGVGQIAEMVRSLELLDLLDSATLNGIPSVFIWDIPPGAAPGANQIARACSTVAASDAITADFLDLPTLPPSVDVALAARTGLQSPVLPASVLAIDADVSLGGLPVTKTSACRIAHGQDSPHLRHGIVWFGRAGRPELQAAAAARGAGVVSVSDPLLLPTRHGVSGYRPKNADDRETMALDLMDRARESLPVIQRSLYVHHHPSVEIGRVSALTSSDWKPGARFGLAIRCARDNPALAMILQGQVLAPDEVIVIDPQSSATVSNRPLPRLFLVDSDHEALRHMREASVEGWLVINELKEDLDWSNALLDAARLLSYGLDIVSVTKSHDTVAQIVSTTAATGMTTLNIADTEAGGAHWPRWISAEHLGWAT